jgi:mannose-6-phosphate isomerase-like protein (cupin superfamily)
MNEASKPMNPEKEAIHLAAEAKVSTFTYKAPDAMERVKEIVQLTRTPSLRVNVQVVKEGGENNLHYHTNSDGVWIVLRGGAKFYGPGDTLIGDLGVLEGITLPGGARYWFEKTGDEELEILQIVGVHDASKKTARINLTQHKEWMTDGFLQQYENTGED